MAGCHLFAAFVVSLPSIPKRALRTESESVWPFDGSDHGAF